MQTKSDIKDVLCKLNVPQDRPVMVHTALRSIGPMEGGAQTLLDALIDHCTREGGLLCVPTHTWGFMDADITLDLTEPKSNLGVFPNIALQDARGIRSHHITHSVTVFGEQAAQFAKLDEIATTMVSECCKELYRQEGYVLLIGVGQEKKHLFALRGGNAGRSESDSR